MSSLAAISIAVYYLDAQGVAQVRVFAGAPGAALGPALKEVEQLRRAGMRHVCISSDNLQSVGKPGVDGVEDGKTPDGQAYGWTKRRRR